MKTYLTTEEENLKGRVEALEQLLVRLACYLRVYGFIHKNSIPGMAINRMIRCCIAEHMSDADFVEALRNACATSEERLNAITKLIEKGD